MYNNKPGIPFHGELVSSNLTTAAELTLYEAGSSTARTLTAYEYVEIDDIVITTTAATDVTVFVSDDATISGGERVLAGDYPVNGGEDKAFKQPFVGQVGATIRAVAGDAGDIKITAQGRIRRGERTGRPGWKEAVNGD